MRKIFWAFALSMLALSPAAMAQSAAPLTIGGKAGFFKPHGSDNDSGLTVGATIGRNIQDNFSWEADLMLGITDGELGRNRDYEITSVAGYGVWRSPGKVHFKAKAGVGYWDDDFDDDINLTMGVGIGINLNRGVLDIEYTQINDYVDYVTVGYRIPF